MFFSHYDDDDSISRETEIIGHIAYKQETFDILIETIVVNKNNESTIIEFDNCAYLYDKDVLVAIVENNNARAWQTKEQVVNYVNNYVRNGNIDFVVK